MANDKEELTIPFGDKFTSKDFDNFIIRYFNQQVNYKKVIFDLSKIEWIALEEIVFLFSWIRYIKSIHKHLEISVSLPVIDRPVVSPTIFEEYSYNEVEKGKERIKRERREKRLQSLCNVWKIVENCELADDEITISKYKKYSKNNNFSDEKGNADARSVDSNWHSIIPFTKLDSQNIDTLRAVREKVEKKIGDKFKLETKVEEILSKYSSMSSFETKAMSGIITTELFLNSIVHAYAEEEKGKFSECYFAISLRNKIDEEKYIEQKIKNGSTREEAKLNLDYILRTNLKEKTYEEQEYFKNKNNNNIADNESFIEFTFLDYGTGIPNTLRKRYTDHLKSGINDLPLSISHFKKNNNDEFTFSEDSRIIEYAFLLDTSSNPFEKKLEINDYVPRGLYFLVDIVRRYQGLLVVRSGRGKIVYNFKNTEKIAEAVRFSRSDSKLPLFQGTLVSMFLPAKNKQALYNNLVEIKSEECDFEETANDNRIEPEYISINAIMELNKLFKDSEELTQIYSDTFQKLNDKIDSFQNKDCAVYIDFAGTEEYEMFNRKLYFYLCYSPKISDKTKVILVYPTDAESLFQAKQTIKSADVPTYLFRPIPCIIQSEGDAMQIVWLGISNEDDEKLINNSIHKNYHKSKFENIEELGRSVIYLDENEFIKLDLPILEVLNICKENYHKEFYITTIPENYIKKCLEEKKDNIIYEDDIYWASGGYYQTKFISLIELLYSFDCRIIDSISETFGKRSARYLLEKYKNDNQENSQIDYIVTVTLSSQLLGRYIKNMYPTLFPQNKEPELIRLANYHEFEDEIAFGRIKENKNVLIVNDVISTGKLLMELHQKITEKRKATICAFFAIVDSRTPKEDNNSVKHYYDFKNDKTEKKTVVYKLCDYPIVKYKRREWIPTSDPVKKIISIDPVINTPSMMNLDRSMGNNLLYFETKTTKTNKEFLDSYTSNNQLWIGHFHFNMAHHLYYFKTKSILQSKEGYLLLNEIFDFIWQDETKGKKMDYLFYPMYSAIEDLSIDKLMEILFCYPDIQIFPLPRIDTPKGWRFSFPPKLLNAEGWNFENRSVIIIDDGTSTGETILQMIDSTAMIEVNQIIVISVVARLEDFQREFYSRLDSVKGFKQFKAYITQKEDTWMSIAEKHYEESEERLLGVDVDYFAKRIEKHNRPSFKIGDRIGVPLKKNIVQIPVDVFFGVHFHIPVYSPLRHCPLCEEWKKLGEDDRKDAPDSVRAYINQRKQEIALYETDGVPNPLTPVDGLKEYNGLPSYFPQEKEFEVKQIFLARDIIGKIDTYRLYRDYIKDSDGEGKSTYCGIHVDYYLAVILHEERLISSIRRLLPQLVSLLIKAIKNEIGLETDTPTVKLKYNWPKEQIIKALSLLRENILYDDLQIDKIIAYISDSEKATNYLTYLYWNNLRNDKKKNLNCSQLPIIVSKMIDKYGDNKILKKFSQWHYLQLKPSYEKGDSFSYLKRFYEEKSMEYPNHITVGKEFNDLYGRISSIKSLIDSLGMDEYASDIDREVKIANDLFQNAVSNIKSPFLKIIEDPDFKKMLNWCSQKDRYFSADINNIVWSINTIHSFFKDTTTNFISRIDEMLEMLNNISKTYFAPPSISPFAQIFSKHIVTFDSEFKIISDSKTNDLKPVSYQYNDTKTDATIAIHPVLFDRIISELFGNAKKHQNTSIHFIYFVEEEKLKIDCIYKGIQDKDFDSLQQKGEFMSNGLSEMKEIVSFFRGDFHSNIPKNENDWESFKIQNEYKITLAIPLASVEYQPNLIN
jgi:orotate phosphoribosyltransferase